MVTSRATQLKPKKVKLFIGLLNKFEVLFDYTIGKWYTEPVDLELKSGSKTFNSR